MQPASVALWATAAPPLARRAKAKAIRVTIIGAFSVETGLARHSLGGGDIDFAAFVVKALAHFDHSAVGVFRNRPLFLQSGEFPDLLGDLHRAELGSAHRAEVRGLGALGGKGLVVECLGGVGVEAEVELVAPAELEAGAAQCVVVQSRGGVTL